MRAASDHEGQQGTDGDRHTLEHPHRLLSFLEAHVRATRKDEGSERADCDSEALDEPAHVLPPFPNDLLR